MFQALKWIAIATSLIFTSSQAFALRSDSSEKLYIVSDSSVYNYKTGTKIFEGHVKMDQGTTHLIADKVVTKNNAQHKIAEAIAYGYGGQKAHYWTTPNQDDPAVYADAKIIKFYPIDSNVVLEQNVIVKQGENSFQGELILYNMNNQTITVPASQSGRAVLVYNPDK
jgi:lipopolysaccharide export system protein LptA